MHLKLRVVGRRNFLLICFVSQKAWAGFWGRDRWEKAVRTNQKSGREEQQKRGVVVGRKKLIISLSLTGFLFSFLLESFFMFFSLELDKDATFLIIFMVFLHALLTLYNLSSFLPHFNSIFLKSFCVFVWSRKRNFSRPKSKNQKRISRRNEKKHLENHFCLSLEPIIIVRLVAIIIRFESLHQGSPSPRANGDHSESRDRDSIGLNGDRNGEKAGSSKLNNVNDRPPSRSGSSSSRSTPNLKTKDVSAPATPFTRSL